MASKGKKTPISSAIDGLTRLTRDRPHPNDLWGSLLNASDSLLAETSDPNVRPFAKALLSIGQVTPIPDATFALKICAALEQALELAICTHFVLEEEGCSRMFDDGANGPLGTFSAKIKMAHALGIYPKHIRGELDLIRNIRNAFAHSWEHMNFTTAAIIAGCDALRIPDLNRPLGAEVYTAKARFLRSVHQIYIYLEWDSITAGVGPMKFESHPGRSQFAGVETAT